MHDKKKLRKFYGNFLRGQKYALFIINFHIQPLTKLFYCYYVDDNKRYFARYCVKKVQEFNYITTEKKIV